LPTCAARVTADQAGLYHGLDEDRQQRSLHRCGRGAGLTIPEDLERAQEVEPEHPSPRTAAISCRDEAEWNPGTDSAL
jgi:hypothetical protein